MPRHALSEAHSLSRLIEQGASTVPAREGRREDERVRSAGSSVGGGWRAGAIVEIEGAEDTEHREGYTMRWGRRRSLTREAEV